jgi:hypothetical protein
VNNLILCEGKTDAILLSYYLERVYGWKYSAKSPIKNLDIKGGSNQSIYWYKKSSNYLLIFGVGGKDNFGNVIQKYIEPMMKNYNSADNFKKIAIMSDKDNLSISEIEEKQCQYFNGMICDIKNGEWKTNKFEDNFGNDVRIAVLSIIIPLEKQGALETILLDSIGEDANDHIIVEKCKCFIEDIQEDAVKYIYSERLALKARLSTVFAVISPEKVFDFLDEIMKNVAWEKSEGLNTCFIHLGEL